MRRRLDPAKREDMWDVVRRLISDGSTVLLTTQYLEEADALADELPAGAALDHPLFPVVWPPESDS